MEAVNWGDFEAREPALASEVEKCLSFEVSFLGTVRPDGYPRVHPVGPLGVRDGMLVVSMFPTSPKGHDIRRNGRYVLHGGIANGVEVLVTGTAIETAATESDRTSGYIAFELLVGEVLVTKYENHGLTPIRNRWKLDSPRAHDGKPDADTPP